MSRMGLVVLGLTAMIPTMISGGACDESRPGLEPSGSGGAGGGAGAGGRGGPPGSGGTSPFDPTADCATYPAHISCYQLYDIQIANGCQTTPTGLQIPASTGTCGGYLTYVFDGGYSSSVCSYDPATKQLVSGRDCTDYPAYCGGLSFCQRFGPVVDRCDRATYTPICATGSGGSTGGS